MRAYIDGDSTTSQREIPFEIEGLTALAEQHHLNNQGGETNKYEKLARLLSLEKLNRRQKQCIHLYYWKGLTEEKIAAKLKLDRLTVNFHIKKGVEALRFQYELNNEHIYNQKGQKIDVIELFRYAIANFVFKRTDRIQAAG